MRLLLVGAALALAGCVSTAVKSYVGQDITEVFMAAGPPEAVFDLPDGRRAFQYRWGGGSFAAPGNANINATDFGRWSQASVTYMPARLVESEGCLVTFLTTQSGKSWRITDTRYPKRLVC